MVFESKILSGSSRTEPQKVRKETAVLCRCQNYFGSRKVPVPKRFGGFRGCRTRVVRGGRGRGHRVSCSAQVMIQQQNAKLQIGGQADARVLADSVI